MEGLDARCVDLDSNLVLVLDLGERGAGVGVDRRQQACAGEKTKPPDGRMHQRIWFFGPPRTGTASLDVGGVRASRTADTAPFVLKR